MISIIGSALTGVSDPALHKYDLDIYDIYVWASQEREKNADMVEW